MNVEDIDAKPPGDDAQPMIKSETLDEMTSPSNIDLIVNKTDMDPATAITKRSRHDVDMDEPTAETSASGTSSKTATVSTRVTRQSKRLKGNADPIEDSMIGDTDQANFVLNLFAMRTGFDGKCLRFLRFSNLSYYLAGKLPGSSTPHTKSSRTTPAISTSTRSGSVIEGSGQSIKDKSISNTSGEDDDEKEDGDD
jgi:hypothetical protein